MKKLNVRITKNGRFLKEAKERFIRRCPDGSPGVVFRRKAYRVLEDNTINIDDDYFDKEECPIVNTDSTIIKKIKTVDWYLESNKFGHYILFNGDQQLMEKVLLIMDDKGIEWLRADKSSRKSDNEIQYDWFIRLKSNLTRSKVLKIVEPILDDPIDISILKGRIQQDLLKQKDKEILILKQQLHAFNNNQEMLQLKAKFSKYQLNKLQKNLDQKKEIDTNELAQLKDDYSDKIKDAEDIVFEEIEKNEELVERINILTQEVEILKLKDNETITVTKVKMDTINLLSKWLKGMYPRLQIDDESLDVIANYFTRYEALCRQLNFLVFDREKFKSYGVKTAKSWFEAGKHIATGSDDNGRIYYRQHYNKNKYDYTLWIRIKRSQRKDFSLMVSFNKKLPSA